MHHATSDPRVPSLRPPQTRPPASTPAPIAVASTSAPLPDGPRIKRESTMAASTKSLSSLLAQATIADHDEVLTAANAALGRSKGDLDAQHTKAVALLHLDRYADSLQVFEGAHELQEKARFEYAYALYKTGNAARAAQVAAAAGPDAGRGMKHMLAQAVRTAGVA